MPVIIANCVPPAVLPDADHLLQAIAFMYPAEYNIVLADHNAVAYRLNHNRLSRFNDRGQTFPIKHDNAGLLVF